jgi:membrane dipeptidase
VAGFVWQPAADALVPAIAEAGRRSAGVTDPRSLRRIRQEVLRDLAVPRPPLTAVADHVEHVARVAGVEHVGIGGDYDGNQFWPMGMEDVTSYPHLFAELIRRGWTDADLARLAGGNVLRVMREAEAVAARLRRAGRAPSLERPD